MTDSIQIDQIKTREQQQTMPMPAPAPVPTPAQLPATPLTNQPRKQETKKQSLTL